MLPWKAKGNQSKSVRLSTSTLVKLGGKSFILLDTLGFTILVILSRKSEQLL